MSAEAFKTICVITFPENTPDELVNFIYECIQSIPEKNVGPKKDSKGRSSLWFMFP